MFQLQTPCWLRLIERILRQYELTGISVMVRAAGVTPSRAILVRYVSCVDSSEGQCVIKHGWNHYTGKQGVNVSE